MGSDWSLVLTDFIDLCSNSGPERTWIRAVKKKVFNYFNFSTMWAIFHVMSQCLLCKRGV